MALLFAFGPERKTFNRTGRKEEPQRTQRKKEAWLSFDNAWRA
jgi:hypothetical protein